jgi:hypothetical protein
MAFANLECFYGCRQGSFEKGIRNGLIKEYLSLPFDAIYEPISPTAIVYIPSLNPHFHH